jgi:hypothetical protein
MFRSIASIALLVTLAAAAHAATAADTLFVPEEPRDTDRSVITGADEAALAAREAAISTVISVAPEDDLVAKLQAAREHLLSGTPVKVQLAAGTWTLTEHERLQLDDQTAKDPMLVIEGAGAGESIIDFAGNDSKQPLLELNTKHHVILRGFSLRNHHHVPLFIGRYYPIHDNAQFLFEDLEVSGCGETGIIVFHMDGITIRGVNSSDNGRSGLFIIAQNAIVEDSVFSGNRGAGKGSFRGGIALAAKDCLIRRVRCDDNPERASGIRMDHLCENVVIEDSSFNRNGQSGTVWETALGPCRIERSEMIDNEESGIILATAYDFELVDCIIRDNAQAQILIQTKPREVKDMKRGIKSGAYGAADIEAGIGEQWTNLKGMMGNRFFTVTGCTIATDDRDAAFYEHEYGKPEIYRTLFTEQFTAADNSYRSPVDSGLFDTFQGPYSKLELIDLEAWRAWTGQEQGSTWTER